MNLLIGSSVATVRLRRKEEYRLQHGHLWAFSNEIDDVSHGEGAMLANCFSAIGAFLGSALYSSHSLIACRLLDRSLRAEQLTAAWLQDRVGVAVELRRRLFPSESAVRWLFGESDGLPGIVLDRYDDVAVAQTYCAGADALLPLLVQALVSSFGIRSVIERNESPLREHEELPRRRSVLAGDQPAETGISELGIRFRVDLWEGQKTGFFLDQKINRYIARLLSAGAEVLDCYCNAGGFALNALLGGATRATAVDTSAHALNLATESARLNGWEGRLRAVQADVFEFLGQGSGPSEAFDLVILDPPSFTRNRKSVPAARKAYVKLNALGMSVLRPGGLLLTASCSHHITEETFVECVLGAASRTGRELQLLAGLSQSPDHPWLPAMPETKYLKGGVYRVL
jgi:23S rRNA (cytosine1962-C5)-methyltransferase